jgi:hypothetical protein
VEIIQLEVQAIRTELLSVENLEVKQKWMDSSTFINLQSSATAKVCRDWMEKLDVSGMGIEYESVYLGLHNLGTNIQSIAIMAIRVLYFR